MKTALQFLGSAILLLYLFWMQHKVCQGNLGFDSTSVEDTHQYRDGQAQYRKLKQYSQLPNYSPCWTRALEHLEQGCSELTDDQQHRLSLEFAGCFLERVGKKTYPCAKTEDLKDCTKDMSTEAFHTYTEFFTHTQNMCFFLKAQVWHSETKRAVGDLLNTSATVTKQLEGSSHLQKELIQQQNASIENQGRILESGKSLRGILENSKRDVVAMITEFRESTTEQKALIFEVFDRVNSLQSVVMGEFTGFYSMIFYLVSITVSYLLTSTPRTGGARFWLFALMTSNILIERFIVYVGVDEEYLITVNIADSNVSI